MNRNHLLGAAFLVVAFCAASVRGEASDWPAILGTSQGALPAPRPTVRWLDNMDIAMRQALLEGRPLFVTMRCLPCKQCSAFDKDVLEGGPQLDPLLRQFITVRITDVRNIDLRQFPMEEFQDT